MNMIYVGVGLMVFGVVLFGIAQIFKGNTVKADNGSIAIGGDSGAPIINTHINQKAAEKHSGGHGLTYVAVVVELTGIGVTIWHALHLAAK
jgi:hypothetical protein